MADFSCSISPGQEIDSIKKWNSILFYRMCAQNADVYDVCCYCSDLFCFVLFDFLISNNNTTLQTFSKLGRGSATQHYYSLFVSATTLKILSGKLRRRHRSLLLTAARLLGYQCCAAAGAGGAGSVCHTVGARAGCSCRQQLRGAARADAAPQQRCGHARRPLRAARRAHHLQRAIQLPWGWGGRRCHRQHASLSVQGKRLIPTAATLLQEEFLPGECNDVQ